MLLFSGTPGVCANAEGKANAMAAAAAANVRRTGISSWFLVCSLQVIRFVDVLVRIGKKLLRLAEFAAELQDRRDAGAVELALLLDSLGSAEKRVPRLLGALLARLRNVLAIDG